MLQCCSVELDRKKIGQNILSFSSAFFRRGLGSIFESTVDKIVTSVYFEIVLCVALFVQAEHLRPHWHENLLYIIKCYIGKKDYTRAVEWIKKANEMEPLCVDV